MKRTQRKEEQKEIEELQRLEKTLPEHLPPISVELIQAARNKQHLDELRNKKSEDKDNYTTICKYQELLADNAKKLMEELDTDHREIVGSLEDMLLIHQKLTTIIDSTE